MPDKTRTFDTSEALEMIDAGETIKRLSDKEGKMYLKNRGEIKCIKDGKMLRNFFLSIKDFKAKDWVKI